MQRIIILLNKLTRCVNYTSSKVSHKKTLVIANLTMRFELRLARNIQTQMLGILGVHTRGKMCGAGGGQTTLLVEQVKNANVFALDELNAVLVIYIGDFAQAQTLFFVDSLLFFENPLVEELLQLFIAVVDAELLEAVHRKVLKSRDVQKANKACGRAKRYGFVHAGHYMVEQL